MEGSGEARRPAPVYSCMSYYHWASKPTKLRRRRYPQKGHPKPNGLWFDVNGSWKRWCETIQFHLEDLCYRHTVTILDKSRVLFLKNMEDIDRFTRDYGHNLSGHIKSLQSPEDMQAFEGEYGHDLFGDILARFSNYILWGEVAEKYTGIIVDPYFQEKGSTYLWYYGWNCAGGCIWDTNVIRFGKSLKLGTDE